MTSQVYTISDISKQLEIECYILRNWEYELKLNIKRDKSGHRLYTEDNIKTLKMIKRLEQHGFIIKHIRLLLPSFNQLTKLTSEDLYSLKDKLCKNFSPSSTSKYEEKKPTTNNQDENNDTYFEIEHSSTTFLSKKDILHNMFKEILIEIINENYDSIKKDLISSITTSISKEFNYHLMQHESNENEYLETISYKLFPQKRQLFKKKIVLK